MRRREEREHLVQLLADPDVDRRLQVLLQQLDRANEAWEEHVETCPDCSSDQVCAEQERLLKAAEAVETEIQALVPGFKL